MLMHYGYVSQDGRWLVEIGNALFTLASTASGVAFFANSAWIMSACEPGFVVLAVTF